MNTEKEQAQRDRWIEIQIDHELALIIDKTHTKQRPFIIDQPPTINLSHTK